MELTIGRGAQPPRAGSVLGRADGHWSCTQLTPGEVIAWEASGLFGLGHVSERIPERRNQSLPPRPPRGLDRPEVGGLEGESRLGGGIGVDSPGAVEQSLFGLHAVGIGDADVDRAHRGTLPGGREADALRAESGVELDLVLTRANAIVGADGYARAAVDACAGDQDRHEGASSCSLRVLELYTTRLSGHRIVQWPESRAFA